MPWLKYGDVKKENIYQTMREKNHALPPEKNPYRILNTINPPELVAPNIAKMRMPDIRVDRMNTRQ